MLERTRSLVQMPDDMDPVLLQPAAAPDETPAKTPRPGWPHGLRLLTGLALVVLLVAPLVIWRAELAQVFSDREQVVAQVRAAGARGPLVVIGLIIAQVVIAPIPGQVVNLVAGYLYGWAAGLLYSWSGMVLGSTLALALARYAGRPLVDRLVSPTLLARLDRLAVRGGWRFILLVFLIPGLPDDVLCFAAGLTPLPLRLLILLSATARIPGVLGAVWLGAYAEQVPSQIWALIGLLAVVGSIIAWRFGKRIQDALLRHLAGGRDVEDWNTRD